MNQIFINGYDIINSSMTQLTDRLDYIVVILIVLATIFALNLIRLLIAEVIQKHRR